MKKIWLILLLPLFLIGCDDDIIYDEYSNAKNKTDEINDIATESDMLTVTQYVKSIEIAIMEYQLDHDDIPDTFCDLKPYLDYNQDIVCKVDFSLNYEIVLEHCKVNGHKKNSYRYDKVASIETERQFYKGYEC